MTKKSKPPYVKHSVLSWEVRIALPFLRLTRTTGPSPTAFRHRQHTHISYYSCCRSSMMTSNLGANEKLALIKENLAEILNPEVIERVLADGRNPRIYWGGRRSSSSPQISSFGSLKVFEGRHLRCWLLTGTAPTGRPHAGCKSLNPPAPTPFWLLTTPRLCPSH